MCTVSGVCTGFDSVSVNVALVAVSGTSSVVSDIVVSSTTSVIWAVALACEKSTASKLPPETPVTVTLTLSPSSL